MQGGGRRGRGAGGGGGRGRRGAPREAWLGRCSITRAVTVTTSPAIMTASLSPPATAQHASSFSAGIDDSDVSTSATCPRHQELAFGEQVVLCRDPATPPWIVWDLHSCIMQVCMPACVQAPHVQAPRWLGAALLALTSTVNLGCHGAHCIAGGGGGCGAF